MTVSSIRDILKTFAQSLQVSTIFPATLFVFANVYLVFPGIVTVNLDTIQSTSNIVSLSLLVSYLLYAFNFPLIRFFEGYKLRENEFSKYLYRKQLAKYHSLDGEITNYDKLRSKMENRLRFNPDKHPDRPLSYEDAVEWNRIKYELSRLSMEKDRFFPSKEASVLPTKLGNVIAAFEDYPRTRYGMESIVLWARLVPLLKNNGYISFVAQEKTVFDFILNIIIVISILGVELFYKNLLLFRLHISLFWLFLLFPILWIFYQGLVVAAREWGTTFRVAFDLHRHQLHDKLGLVPQPSFEKDIEQWVRVSAFLNYQSEYILNRPETEDIFKDFYSSSQVNEQKMKSED